MGLPGGFAAAQVARRLLADHQHIDRAAVPSQRHEHPADAARARRVLVGVAAAVVERARAGGAAAEESAEVIQVDTPRRRLVQQLARGRSEEHTSELQSLMRISYACFCLKKK